MSKTVLCVDDSVTIQRVCEITFRSTDYAYVGAKSADEGIEKAKASKPSIILVDAVMPGKTGYDLCQAVKADAGLADVPVILMCGNSAPYDEGKGSSVGADGHVAKPWDTTKLIEQLDKFVEAGASKPAAKPAAAAAPAPRPEPAPAPAPAPMAAAPAIPSTPKAPPPVVPPQPPRSATLMGLPQMQMPATTKKPPGVTSLSSKHAVPEVVKPPAAPAPAAPAAKADGRAPMIAGKPDRMPAEVAAKRVQQAMPAAAAEVAREAGLDPGGPEMEAVMKLSAKVVERIAWEVVPELAELIIRENLDRLAAKAR